MTPDEMNIKQIIPYLEEHGQHYTCDHNSNFDQGICERAIYFLKELQAENERLEQDNLRLAVENLRLHEKG